ncbi:extracellular solute-binding protein [Paenibacillus sp. CAU 1782]
MRRRLLLERQGPLLPISPETKTRSGLASLMQLERQRPRVPKILASWTRSCLTSRLGLLLLLGCLFLVAAGCKASEDGGGVKQLEEGQLPYEEPVTIKVAYSYSDITLPEGDVGDQNFMSRYIKDKLGIVIKYDWEASAEEQYNTMLDLAIQSSDLPDVFVVNRSQFLTLIERNLIADLTSFYPRFASPIVRSIYDSTDGGALKEATFDGKLYAFPNVVIEADTPSYLWVRQDWLDKLNLPAPSTLEDIEHIARAFIERDPDGNNVDDTLGLPVDKSLVYNKKTGIYGLDSIFASYHAFPKSWYRNGEGHVVYGSIQAEAKQALELLARWYREGIIDPEFMLRKESEYSAEQNQVGLLFAPWWGPYWPLGNSISKDAKAEWKVYAAPKDASGQFVTRSSAVTDSYLVVRKDYPHPEAALKILNLFTELERFGGEEDAATTAIRATAQQMGNQLRNYFPLTLLLDDRDAVIKRHDILVKALEGELEIEDMNQEMQEMYANILFEQENPRKDLEAWSISQAYLQGGKISKEPMIRVEALFVDSTPAYDQYWPSLQRLEQDYYLKMITGELPIEAFDTFVEEWMNNGGKKVMKEVGEWADARN